MNTPTNNPAGDNCYTVQFTISWGFKDPSGKDDVPPGSRERLENMKQRASHFAEPFRSAILAVPGDTPVTEIKLGDWPCLGWDNQGGIVTLAGDAAHAMTMCMFSLLIVLWRSTDENRQIAGKRRIMESWML